MEIQAGDNKEKIPFETALDRAGFGLYSYCNTAVSGMVILALACVVYGSVIVVPASACELETTSAQQGLLVAAPVVGVILGGPFWGILGDTKGRRNTLIISLLCAGVVNAVSAISVNWIMLMILQFTASLLGAAQFTMAMTLLGECVPMAKRNLVVLLVSSIYMLYQGFMAVLAIPIIPLSFSYYLSALDIYWNSWRTLVVVFSLPSFICACCLYFMQESPKFALMKGDELRALKILRVIHKLNHRNGTILDVEGLLPEATSNTIAIKIKDKLAQLFRAPLLKFTIIMSALYMFQLSGSFAAWLPTIANRVITMYETGEVASLTLCGILNSDITVPVDVDAVPCALNTTSLLMVLLVGVVQSSVNALLTFVVVNRAGCRNTIIAVTAVVGLCGILVNLVPNPIGTSILFGIFLMGITVVGLYTTLAVALFPTHLRATAVSITMTAGRVTTFTVIQLVRLLLDNNCDLGFYLFAAIFTSSVIFASLLPDDRLSLRSRKKRKQQS